jgi:hypothetical protein
MALGGSASFWRFVGIPNTCTVGVAVSHSTIDDKNNTGTLERTSLECVWTLVARPRKFMYFYCTVSPGLPVPVHCALCQKIMCSAEDTGSGGKIVYNPWTRRKIVLYYLVLL